MGKRVFATLLKKCRGTTEVAGIQCPKEKDMRRNEWDCIQTVSAFETLSLKHHRDCPKSCV